MHEEFHPEDFGAVRVSLADKAWQYRGEGNSNLVISLISEHKVIRLPKFGRRELKNDLSIWKRLQANNVFISSVMIPLLGQELVSTPSLVYLEQDEIEHLNSVLNSLRPENRKNKMLSFCGGELYEDCAFLTKQMKLPHCHPFSICVELKPKQGIFTFNRGQLRNCTFCRKQQLKLKKGLTSVRCQYCPLDLFSGFQPRMKHALKSLLQCPQNNLRIFQDGSLIFADGSSLGCLENFLCEWLHPVSGSDVVERFLSLLIQSLTTEIVNGSQSTAMRPPLWVFDGPPPSTVEEIKTADEKDYSFPSLEVPPCNFGRQDLKEGCILYRLARAQAFDQWGTHFVHDLLPCYEEGVESTESSETSYVYDLVRKGRSSRLNPIELYLLAAVVRDCSILATFQEWEQNSGIESVPLVKDDPSSVQYMLNITVVDVGPKPVSCIKRHIQRDAAISEACREAALT